MTNAVGTETTRTRYVGCRISLGGNCLRRPYARLGWKFLEATANVAKVTSIAKGGNFGVK